MRAFGFENKEEMSDVK